MRSNCLGKLLKTRTLFRQCLNTPQSVIILWQPLHWKMPTGLGISANMLISEFNKHEESCDENIMVCVTKRHFENNYSCFWNCLWRKWEMSLLRSVKTFFCLRTGNQWLLDPLVSKLTRFGNDQEFTVITRREKKQKKHLCNSHPQICNIVGARSMFGQCTPSCRSTRALSYNCWQALSKQKYEKASNNCNKSNRQRTAFKIKRNTEETMARRWSGDIEE